MKKMRIETFPACILFLFVCFVLAALTRPASAENKKAGNIDDDGAVKIQTDIDVKEDAPEDKGKVKTGDTEEDVLGVDDDTDQEDEINTELIDDFARLARVSKLDKKQQLQLLQIQKARELALENWDKK